MAYAAGWGNPATEIVHLVGCPNCYADCDQSGALNVADFACFIDKFAQRDPYCNCDMSFGGPTINVADFACYLRRFATGCP